MEAVAMQDKQSYYLLFIYVILLTLMSCMLINLLILEESC